MRRLLWIVLIAGIPLGGALALPPAPSAIPGLQERDEIEVKAAWLHNFARFCDWPEKALPKESKIITLGILGPKETYEKIKDRIHGKLAGQRTIKVVPGAVLADLDGAQLIFLAQAERDQAPGLLQALRTAPVVTVGEFPGFSKGGGIFNFYLAKEGAADKLRFKLNLEAAERSGIKVTKLIKVADTEPEK